MTTLCTNVSSYWLCLLETICDRRRDLTRFASLDALEQNMILYTVDGTPAFINAMYRYTTSTRVT